MKTTFKKIKYIILLLCIATSFLFSCENKTNLNNNSLHNNNVSQKNNTTDNVVLGKEKNWDSIKKAKESLNLKYSKKREDFVSDEVFANFRNLKVGRIKENILYRGASPIENSYNRAKYANALIKNVNIKYDVDLSDNNKKVEKNAKKRKLDSDYFLSLYKDNKVSLLNMTTDFKDEKNYIKAVKGLTEMAKSDGPYYVHCVEGKHRTGFFCILIEAINGATYEEMVDDFMITFSNYNGITKENNENAYEIIKSYYVDEMLRTISGINDYNVDLSSFEWESITKKFLIKNGMSEADLNLLCEKLTN